MTKLSTLGPPNSNLAERLQKADQALQKTMQGLDKAADKKMEKANSHLAKAGRDLGLATYRGKEAATEAGSALLDGAFAVGDTGAAGLNATKGVGFTLAGAVGKLADALRAALADALVAVGKAFLRGSSKLDGRSFVISELAGDPKATSWGDRMMHKGFEDFTKTGQSLKNVLNDLAAGVADGVYGVKDIIEAGVYLTAAAGQTLAAATDTGEAVIIANAEAAVNAADAIVKGAKAGNARVADGLASAGMKLIEAQNAVNTAKNPKYISSEGVGY